jgi:hypothetical protein
MTYGKEEITPSGRRTFQTIDKEAEGYDASSAAKRMIIVHIMKNKYGLIGDYPLEFITEYQAFEKYELEEHARNMQMCRQMDKERRTEIKHEEEARAKREEWEAKKQTWGSEQERQRVDSLVAEAEARAAAEAEAAAENPRPFRNVSKPAYQHHREADGV